MEHEKYSYVESLKWLAGKYGIEIEETFQSDEQRESRQVAESLFIINSFAQQFFSKILFETEEGQDVGLSYLKERGYREDVIKKFQLGYSPEQKDAFAGEAIAQQYNTELLLKTGLVVKRNEQLVDNYRGRIIFPIHNHSGKVLGFGARILKNNEKAPKYINTPENEIYIKSRILYGSYFARQSIDKNDECLLVEGYTDVISLHQAGIENVVASGGTSLTQEQLRLVRKYSNNLTIIYDGDAAGIKAALRGMDLALEEGLNVKLVLIPDKDDPDSFVNKVGAAAFKEFVTTQKKDFILFQLEVALKDSGTDSNKKAAVINQVAETISKINKAEDFSRQQDYIKQCSELLKIDESGLHSLVNKFIRNRIVTKEKALPFEEAKKFEENAKEGNTADYDDATFTLLFKDDLQEKEMARMLLEHGLKKWDDNRMVAEYILEELEDETLIDNPDVLKFLKAFKEQMQQAPEKVTKNSFIYHPDQTLSTLAVTLLNFPYEESDHWRREFNQASGYRAELFKKGYDEFMNTISKDKETALIGYLNTEEDLSLVEVDSAVNYLKLRKIKRLLLHNQEDMEKTHTPEEYEMLHQTHVHLKSMEMELTKKMGAVIIR